MADLKVGFIDLQRNVDRAAMFALESRIAEMETKVRLLEEKVETLRREKEEMQYQLTNHSHFSGGDIY